MPEVLPHLVPPAGVVRLGAWHLIDRDGEERPLGPEYPGWDPHTTLRIRRGVTIDIDRVREACRIPNSVPLRAIATWTSTTSKMVGPVGRISSVSTGINSLEGSLPGDRVGGTVSITTRICVGATWRGTPGMPTAGGAILFTDQHALSLEQDGSMFPVEVVDFAGTRYDPDASWHLTLDPDLSRPVLGALRLSINHRDRELVEAVGASKRTPKQALLLEEMYHSVAQLLYEAAEIAQREHAVADNVWPEESLGQVLARFVDSTVPATPVSLFDVTDRAAQRAGRARRAGYGRRLT